MLREPWVQLVVFLGLGIAIWLTTGRYRPLALFFFAGALFVIASYAFPVLEGFELGWLAQAILLFAAGTMLASGVLVPVDRYLRMRPFARLPEGPWSPYVGPIFTGLSATVGSLVGLYWLSAIRESADIRGPLELAILGGILTATIGITRADREHELSRGTR